MCNRVVSPCLEATTASKQAACGVSASYPWVHTHGLGAAKRLKGQLRGNHRVAGSPQIHIKNQWWRQTHKIVSPCRCLLAALQDAGHSGIASGGVASLNHRLMAWIPPASCLKRPMLELRTWNLELAVKPWVLPGESPTLGAAWYLRFPVLRSSCRLLFGFWGMRCNRGCYPASRRA
jgi:hypothetical protein